MGTGIVSVLIHNLPYNGAWLHDISYIFFVLNIVLFVCFNIITLLRYTLYPEIWLVMVRHPAQSMFLGCYPMGLASELHSISISPFLSAERCDSMRCFGRAATVAS